MSAEGVVTVVAAADHSGQDPDLYQLLGVPRGASRDEITRAWRRLARAEHPDARPADADAPGRFRTIADAYQVLGDPGRRAAYDRDLDRGQQPAVRIPVRRVPGPGRAGGQPQRVGVPEPPVRAGPVRVEGPSQEPPAGSWDERDIRVAMVARLALRYLAREWDRPW